jgi:release factor glutamine methyltransferase
VVSRVLTWGGAHRRARVTTVRGVALLVQQDVFDPKRFRTGALLAEAIERERRWSGCRVLDLGTGSGVGAVFAARAGAHVIATDTNPRAVHNARLNARLNGLSDRIEAREGDLFAPVAGERFDHVLFNPPFFRGTPADEFDRAWRSRDVPERFVDGLADHLVPDGTALVVGSTDGTAAEWIERLLARGHEVDVALRRRYLAEIATVWRVRGPT